MVEGRTWLKKSGELHRYDFSTSWQGALLGDPIQAR
jgi:hypothetical protein